MFNAILLTILATGWLYTHLASATAHERFAAKIMKLQRELLDIINSQIVIHKQITTHSKEPNIWALLAKVKKMNTLNKEK